MTSYISFYIWLIWRIGSLVHPKERQIPRNTYPASHPLVNDGNIISLI